MAGLFDGPGAGLVGRVMASMNAEAEAEAVERLAPEPGARVLVLGFGPGVGIELLAARLVDGFVLGVDPSGVMVRMARRRNHAAIGTGRVQLERGVAERVPAAEASFDAVLAVNTLQLCEPIANTAAELARVLRPGGRFISLTHDWAAAKHAPSAGAWTQAMLAAFVEAGFVEGSAFPAKAEGGRSIVLTATRRET